MKRLLPPVFLPLLVLIVLLRASPAAAFDGSVLDDAGDPVAGAEVSIIGHSGSAMTDRDGRFKWTPDPAAPFRVLVVLPGGRYLAPVVVTEIPAKGPVIIRVAPLVEESVVVAPGIAPHIEAPPAAATDVIGREDIATRQPARLADAIESVPGVGRLGEGHAAVPSIRGLARGRTLILIDGARVTTERRAGPSATFLDPFFLEAIEVSRGPGSVAYGSDALGGVIDARTRRPAPGAPLTVRARASGGVGLPEYGAAVELSRGHQGGGFVVQARMREFGDYRSASGNVPNSSASDRGALVRFEQRTGPGTLTLGLQSDVNRDVGRPTFSTGETRVSYPREKSERFTTDYRFDPKWGFSKLGLSAFAGRYRLVLERDRRASGTTPRTVTRSDVVANDFHLRGVAGRPVGRGRIEFGVEVNGRTGLESTGLVLVPSSRSGLTTMERTESIEDARRVNSGAYGILEVPLTGPRASSRKPGLVLSAGIRGDHISTSNDGGTFGNRDTTNENLSGFASLTLEAGRGVSVTGQAARGFRDPSLSDRYFVGASGRGFVTGNPDLEPERSLQLDLAVRRDGQRLSWGLFGYRYRIEDLVERFEKMDDEFFFRNRGEAVIRGVELEMQARLGLWSVELGGQVSQGETGSDRAPIDDVPPTNGFLGVRRTIGGAGGARPGRPARAGRPGGLGGFVSARVAAARRDRRAGPTEKTTPGYATLDVSGGWRLWESVELRLSAQNVLDKEFFASSDSRATLATGRSARAALLFEF